MTRPHNYLTQQSLYDSVYRMGGSHTNEKMLLERKALAYFLRHYNKIKKSKYSMLEHRERPDFEVIDKLSGRTIGVEISHIFHDKKEAMMLLGRDPSQIHGIITASDHVKVLTRILKQKAEKVRYYPFRGDVILVIRDFSQTFDADMLFDHRLGLKVPRSNYKEIWYLARSSPAKKWDQIVQLR